VCVCVGDGRDWNDNMRMRMPGMPPMPGMPGMMRGGPRGPHIRGPQLRGNMNGPRGELETS